MINPAGSLSTRIAATVASVLTVVLAIFSVWVATQLRGGLFDARRDAIVADASVRFSQAQQTFDQSTAKTPDQVQELANQVLGTTWESAQGAGAVEVALLRSPNSSASIRINEYMNAPLVTVLDRQFLEVLAPDVGYWQSVAFAGPSGEVPGILVGSVVSLPSAGPHQMLLLYSLQSEQATVNMVVRVLLFGAVPVLVVMSLLTFVLIYRMLRPVREAAAAATRLAEGDLDSRVATRGHDEMAMLGRAFNDMASSLARQIHDYDALSRLQQGFVSDVSHELRTPLTTIRMAEDMIYMERDALSPGGQRSAELLHSETERFEDMLADLLEISRHDANSAKLDLEQVDLYSLVERSIEANSHLAAKLGVEVRLGPRPDRCSVPMDAKRMERVLRNLLVNAYEHAEEKPVDVTVASGETSVAVRVRDYGVGLSSATAKRVFDRFFRADPARARTTGGTGLGLAIAKEDVQLHNGVIGVWGEPGFGASFQVTLPREALSAVAEFPLTLWEGKRTADSGGVDGE